MLLAGIQISGARLFRLIDKLFRETLPRFVHSKLHKVKDSRLRKSSRFVDKPTVKKRVQERSRYVDFSESSQTRGR